MIRTSRFAVSLAVVLLAVLPMSAFAESPTADDIVAIKRMFGFDQLITIGMDRAMTTSKSIVNGSKPFGQLNEQQRTCLKEVVMPVFSSKVDAAFAQMFVTHENVAEWIRFADTDGGRKFLDYIRKGVLAISNDATPPDSADLMSQLNATELAQMKAFLNTPAGALLGKGMPDMGKTISPETITALEAEATNRCGIKFGDDVAH